MHKKRGGKKEVAEMLSGLEPEMRERILKEIAGEDLRLAEEIREMLLGFEDLLRLDDISMQLLLKDIPSERLSLALRNASESLKEHVLKNLPTRRRDEISELVESLGQQRLSIVREAQKEIVAILKLKIDSAELTLK